MAFLRSSTFIASQLNYMHVLWACESEWWSGVAGRSEMRRHMWGEIYKAGRGGSTSDTTLSAIPPALHLLHTSLAQQTPPLAVSATVASSPISDARSSGEALRMRCVWPQEWLLSHLQTQLGPRIFSRQVTNSKRIGVKRHQLHDFSQTRSYTHAPLGTGEIRLLDLHPGRHTDPIHCTLRKLSLADKPAYESLSYCWGTNGDEAMVHCGLDHIPVTRNLFSALQHLRCKEHLRTLWIDALSIDQRNLEERGQQVGMMKDIFQRSRRTVIWLGLAAHDSSRAVQLIHQLAEASKGLLSKTNALPPLYDSSWSALARLLKRPWWYRAWIVQEASVSSDVVFLCGSDIFSWDEIEVAIQLAVDLGFFVASGGSATFKALSLFQTRTRFQSQKRPHLHTVLLQHRSSHATDSRDKVFGLLSLADQRNVAAVGIQADYSRTSNELFTTISRSLLKSGNLGALKAAGIYDHASIPGVPSWVTDWSVSDSTVPLDTPNSLIQGSQRTERRETATATPRFHAAGSSICNAIFSDDLKRLKLRGIIVDQIEAVGILSRTRYLRHVSHMFELFVQCYDVLEQLGNWENIARVRFHKLYPTGEPTLDAYWLTLFAGRVPSYLRSERHDSRYKDYILLRLLRGVVRAIVPWFPRSAGRTWYNRFFFMCLQNGWRLLGLTPTKIQGIGFPPESRLPNGRRMVRTKKGYIALAPRLVREGDCVAVCEGGQLPLIVRREGEHWLLLGESYVHGIMNGEAWEEAKCEDMWFE